MEDNYSQNRNSKSYAHEWFEREILKGQKLVLSTNTFSDTAVILILDLFYNHLNNK